MAYGRRGTLAGDLGVRRTLDWSNADMTRNPLLVSLATFCLVHPFCQGAAIFGLLLPLLAIGCSCEMASFQGVAAWLAGGILGSLSIAWAAPRFWPLLSGRSVWRLAAVSTAASWVAVSVLRATELADPYPNPDTAEQMVASLGVAFVSWLVLSMAVLAATLPPVMRDFWLRKVPQVVRP